MYYGSCTAMASFSQPIPDVLYQNSGKISSKEIQDLYPKLVEKSRGVRVFYFNETNNNVNSDHPQNHNQEWKAKLQDGNEGRKCLEAGTTVALTQYSIPGTEESRCLVVVKWDCGFEKAYTRSELSNIRVFDLGPTGYKGEMVFCDKCLIPVMGFAWRLAKDKECGDLYDLCANHYNKNEDPHSQDKFYCNIPTGDIMSQSDSYPDRTMITPRSATEKFDLIGLFKGAKVKDGTVIKIMHQSEPKEKEAKPAPQEDMRFAHYYNCCAEVVLDSSNTLQYRSAGCKGEIDVKVSSPGKWGSIFASHHPSLSFELLQELATYEKCLHQMSDNYYCFMRKKNGKCYSITISGTAMEDIADDSIWEQCHDLEIVILYMNRLSKLPEKLWKFKNTITLVCIQNNKFSDISSLYEFCKLEHLNMHGNYLSTVPKELEKFTQLTRLYLGDNDLICLPEIFSSFPNLKKASFQNNSLTRLPTTFANLHKLENLDISDNAMIKFPQPLLKLQSLKFLNIERNRFQKFIPGSMHRARGGDELYKCTLNFFKQLTHLQFKGNPIQQHKCFEEIEESDVIKFRETLTTDEVFNKVNEIKPSRSLRINVLGQSGAGKTSLVHAFIFGKYVIDTTQKEHRHTVGIDRYYKPVKIGGKTILLNIWDHAGDNEYAMMNDIFISDKSLIWLVVNLKNYCPDVEGADEAIFHEYIGHWLLQVMSHNLNPVVWIICTHTDASSGSNKKIKHIEDRIKRQCNSFRRSVSKASDILPDDLKAKVQKLSDVPDFLLKHKKIIKLTNTYGLEGLHQLCMHLESLPEEYMEAFPDLTIPLPTTWEDEMDRLQKLAEEAVSTSPVIPVTGIEKMFDAECFLDYQHSVGEIYLMKSNVILNINWMINLLKQVYHHEFDSSIQGCHDVDDEIIEEAPKKRKDCGLISEALLKYLWKCTDENLFRNIIEQFESFNLTYTFKDFERNETFYFFPYLIQAKLEAQEEPKNPKGITLQFIFTYFFPQFFMQRLALEFLHDRQNRNTLIRSDGFKTELHYGDMDLLITHTKVSMNSERMKIRILPGCTNSDIGAATLWSVVPDVLQCIHKVLSSYWKFHGDTKVRVLCHWPHCTNYLPLIQPTFKPGNKMLECKECKKTSHIDYMVPPVSAVDQLISQGMAHYHKELNSENFNKELQRLDKWNLVTPSHWPASHTINTDSSLQSYSHQSNDLFSIPQEEVCNNKDLMY